MTDRHKAGDYTRQRVKWVNLSGDEFILYEWHERDPELEDDPYMTPDYPDIPLFRLTYRKAGRKGVSVIMNKFTVEELDALSDFFVDVATRVRPVLHTLDERAEQEYEDGHDANPRQYRPIPRTHDRPRTE